MYVCMYEQFYFQLQSFSDVEFCNKCYQKYYPGIFRFTGKLCIH